MQPPQECQLDCPVSWHGMAHTGTESLWKMIQEGVPLCHEPTPARPRVQTLPPPSLLTLTCRQHTTCSNHRARQSQDHTTSYRACPYPSCTSTDGGCRLLGIWAPVDELKTHKVASLILECGADSALFITLPGRCLTDARLFHRVIESLD